LQALTGVNVAFADFYQLFEGVLANPDRYGYDKTKVTKSCLTGVYHEAPKSLCDDPDKYIFWDEYHVSISFVPFLSGLNVDHCDF
jgi:phospholipase/lecithinase/hemolysin